MAQSSSPSPRATPSTAAPNAEKKLPPRSGAKTARVAFTDNPALENAKDIARDISKQVATHEVEEAAVAPDAAPAPQPTIASDPAVSTADHAEAQADQSVTDASAKLTNAVEDALPVVPDATLRDAGAASALLFEQMIRTQNELAHFMQTRLSKNIENQRALMGCMTFEDIRATQTAFLTATIADYSDAASRIAKMTDSFTPRALQGDTD